MHTYTYIYIYASVGKISYRMTKIPLGIKSKCLFSTLPFAVNSPLPSVLQACIPLLKNVINTKYEVSLFYPSMEMGLEIITQLTLTESFKRKSKKMLKNLKTRIGHLPEYSEI